MNGETQYKVVLILHKIKLIKLVKYIFETYTNHKKRTMKKKQILEIQKFGKYSEIKIGHYKLILDRSDFQDFIMLKIFESGGIYEPEVSSYITKNLNFGENFMDIGANTGYYSILVADLVGQNGKIISIEPNPNAFQRLLHNIKSNDLSNIIALNIALSDHDGKGTLYLNKDLEDGLASIVKGKQFQSLGEVEFKRFDHLFMDEKISIVKIDVEGAEIDIIKTMENYLKCHKETKIIMEWFDIYRNKNDFNYLKELFNISLLIPDRKLGFKLIKVTQFEDIVLFGNVLLEKNS